MKIQENRYCHECGDLIHDARSGLVTRDYSTLSTVCHEPGCVDGNHYVCTVCDYELYDSGPTDDELVYMFGSLNPENDR
jgi:hypothetical protein